MCGRIFRVLILMSSQIRHLHLVKKTVQHRVQHRVMHSGCTPIRLHVLESIHVQTVMRQSWSTTCDVITRTADILVTSETNYKVSHSTCYFFTIRQWCGGICDIVIHSRMRCHEEKHVTLRHPLMTYCWRHKQYYLVRVTQRVIYSLCCSDLCQHYHGINMWRPLLIYWWRHLWCNNLLPWPMSICADMF